MNWENIPLKFNTSLHIAAENGLSKGVKVLLENGADVDLESKSGNTPLLIAAENGHSEAIEILLERGANINLNLVDKNRYTPLIIATQNGHLESMKVLLMKGADVEKEGGMAEPHLTLPSLVDIWNPLKFCVVAGRM